MKFFKFKTEIHAILEDHSYVDCGQVMERLLTFVFPLDSVSFNELRIDCSSTIYQFTFANISSSQSLWTQMSHMFKCCRVIVLVAKIKLEGLIFLHQYTTVPTTDFEHRTKLIFTKVYETCL